MLPTPPPSTPPEEVAAAPDVLGVEILETSDAETEKAPANPYKQLKSFLRLSTSFTAGASVDETIIGRQEEKSAIRAYVGASEAESDVGMYVSGPPGTGKTALVTAIGRDLAEDGWKVVEIGCMGMKPTDIWKEIGEALDCGKTEKDIKEYMAQEKNKVYVYFEKHFFFSVLMLILFFLLFAVSLSSMKSTLSCLLPLPLPHLPFPIFSPSFSLSLSPHPPQNSSPSPTPSTSPSAPVSSFQTACTLKSYHSRRTGKRK